MAMDPGQMPPAEGAAPAPEGQDGGAQAEALISNLTDGLSMLEDVLSSINPGLGQKASVLSSQFKSLIEEAMGGAAPTPEAGGQGVVDPAAAGAAGAIPRG